MEHRHELVTIDVAAGALSGTLHIPDGDPRGAVLLAHCFTCSRSLKTTRALSTGIEDGGFAVLRFDFTGLGESEGDFAETTGTGFIANQDGLILTNRHVALPWENNQAVAGFVERGVVPRMWRFVGFLPGSTEGFAVNIAVASEQADVAVLRGEGLRGAAPPLRLSGVPPDPGAEVIVLGYPLGIRALMARAGDAVVQSIQAEPDLDFWSVAERLAHGQHIAPLASRGIVGQITNQAVVYDAETTSGGSGGPVLGLDGTVFAVNFGVLPEFGGSNLGVPAALARALLNRSGSR